MQYLDYLDVVGNLRVIARTIFSGMNLSELLEVHACFSELHDILGRSILARGLISAFFLAGEQHHRFEFRVIYQPHFHCPILLIRISLFCRSVYITLDEAARRYVP